MSSSLCVEFVTGLSWAEIQFKFKFVLFLKNHYCVYFCNDHVLHNEYSIDSPQMLHIFLKLYCEGQKSI